MTVKCGDCQRASYGMQRASRFHRNSLAPLNPQQHNKASFRRPFHIDDDVDDYNKRCVSLRLSARAASVVWPKPVSSNSEREKELFRAWQVRKRKRGTLTQVGEQRLALSRMRLPHRRPLFGLCLRGDCVVCSRLVRYVRHRH